MERIALHVLILFHVVHLLGVERTVNACNWIPVVSGMDPMCNINVTHCVKSETCVSSFILCMYFVHDILCSRMCARTYVRTCVCTRDVRTSRNCAVINCGPGNSRIG